jgi:cytochrome c oxidase cbb3-type subunit 3
LPRWWLTVLYASIAWAVIYTIFYPAWPWLSGYTRGVLGYNSREELALDLAEAAGAQSQWLVKIAGASTDQIAADPELFQFALAGGRAVFNENCAPCHGVGGAGQRGFPVLADDSWLWGGRLADIEQTIRHGIRAAADDQTRLAEMPRFGADAILSGEQIARVTDFVHSLGGASIDRAKLAEGAAIYAQNCAACHGDAGAGKQDVGAPALNDQIWQFGGDRATVIAQIANPRHGVMPAWQGRLKDELVKMVAVYVHSLGGGQ